MGAVIFLVLFGLGVMLATIGGLIGLVDAFRVSPTWGLLSFFVPFALLVFCIKFWSSRKWAKISLLTSLAGLLSMLAGGPFLIGAVRQQMANAGDALGDASIDQQPIEQVPIDQQPVEQVPVDQVPVEGGDPNFTTPMVPAAPQLANNLAGAELIQSTDPEERVRQINNRRPDPFATVPVPPPPVVVPPPPAPISPIPTAPTATAPTTSPTPIAPTATAPTTTAPTTSPRPTAPTATAPSPGRGAAAQPGSPGSPSRPTTQPGGGTAAQPAGPGGQPSASGPEGIALAPLPALPEPTQAQEVVVTGVVTIGNRNYAIVQSPDEPTGRYVTVGQRVAGGSVLVKRIDLRGNEPVVVLEQNGIEVSHSVGIPEEDQETAAAT